MSARRELFQEAVKSLLQGGRAALRANINATIGFDRPGEVLGRFAEELMRMSGPGSAGA